MNFLLRNAILFGSALHIASAQLPNGMVAPANVQNNTFNASYPDTAAGNVQQIMMDSGFRPDVQEAIKVTLGFERSRWAGSSVRTDPFYNTLPSNWSSAAPGSILKVENVTNTTFYTLPPNTALSRILYQTADINGTSLPASAYILWPYDPREFDSVEGVPLVAWAHGTSGFVGECGPSHYRDLFYQYGAPYTLALQGYAVVAPDFAGLGIDWMPGSNQTIASPFLMSPAVANDIFYSISAAQSAFTELSANFVIMGHSQGGGAAWAAAQRQAQKPVAGYLGTVAVSPATSFVASGPWSIGPAIAMMVGPTLASVFPGFDVSTWLTPTALNYTSLLTKLSACSATYGELLQTATGVAELIQPTWNETWAWPAWQKLSSTGNGTAVAGPMLVLQGTADPQVNPNATLAAVNATCGPADDGANIDLRMFEGATHFPTLYASQRQWLAWIEKRFSGIVAPRGCRRALKTPTRPLSAYQKEVGYYLELALYGYETA